MFKFIFLLAIPGIYALFLIIDKLAKRVEDQTHIRHLSFIRRWEIARNKRLQWLEERPYLTAQEERDEYERLWLEEIGAEELLSLHFPCTRISFLEYRRESTHHEQ